MTVTTEILTPALYDLRDPNGTNYNADGAYAEMLVYLNRALKEGLDPVLSKIGSGFVYNEDTSTTLASSANSVSFPTGAMCIHDPIWYGSQEIVKADLSYIYEQRRFISTTGLPKHFAEHGTTVEFDYTADSSYALVIHYDKHATALTSGGSTPYGGEYNEPLREMLVIMCRRRNELDTITASQLFDFFMTAVVGIDLRKNWKRKQYRRDFF